MRGGDPNRNDDERRRGRFRKQAWVLGILAVVIYFGYVAYLILSGMEA